VCGTSRCGWLDAGLLLNGGIIANLRNLWMDLNYYMSQLNISTLYHGQSVGVVHVLSRCSGPNPRMNLMGTPPAGGSSCASLTPVNGMEPGNGCLVGGFPLLCFSSLVTTTTGWRPPAYGCRDSYPAAELTVVKITLLVQRSTAAYLEENSSPSFSIARTWREAEELPHVQSRWHVALSAKSLADCSFASISFPCTSLS
jgi:hypothetical protein